MSIGSSYTFFNLSNPYELSIENEYTLIQYIKYASSYANILHWKPRKQDDKYLTEFIKPYLEWLDLFVKDDVKFNYFIRDYRETYDYTIYYYLELNRYTKKYDINSSVLIKYTDIELKEMEGFASYRGDSLEGYNLGELLHKDTFSNAKKI